MDSGDGQLELAFGPLFVVEVDETISAPLTGRQGVAYSSPAQPRDDAMRLVALLLDRPEPPEGDGPWRRPLAGGQRTVRLVRAEPQSL